MAVLVKTASIRSTASRLDNEQVHIAIVVEIAAGKGPNKTILSG